MEIRVKTCVTPKDAIRFATITGFIAFIAPAPAFAYLDPGTGSIIVQGLLAAIAVVAGVISVSWQRLKGIFRSLFYRKEPAPAESEQEPQD